MRKMKLVLFIAIGISVMAQAETRKIDFNQDLVDQPPKGFEFGHTAGVGKPGRWVVQADGTNWVLAQTDPDSTRSRVPSCRAVRCDRRRRQSVRPFQADLRSGRPGGRSRLALPEPGQLLHRSRQRARGQRRALQGRRWQAHGSSVEGPRPDIRQEERGPQQASVASCGWWPTGLCSRSISTGSKLYKRRGQDVRQPWQSGRVDQG